MPRAATYLAVLGLVSLLLPLAAFGGEKPGTPQYAASRVYEGGHSLDYSMMIGHACMTGQEEHELKAFFESQIEELEAAGVEFGSIEYDFSKLTYTLLEEDGDLARVRIEGPYGIVSPTGTRWDEDPDVVILQRIDGVWKMCGDQTRSGMSLAEYRRWMEDPASVAGEAPESGPSPVEVARAFCEAVYRIDGRAMEEHMCRAMREAGVAAMADQALQQFESMGVDWSEVRHDFSNLKYELVRQEGGMAEVRLSGVYARSHPVLGGEEQQEDQLFTLTAEDGRWVVCE